MFIWADMVVLVISSLGKQRQEDWEFKAILDYVYPIYSKAVPLNRLSVISVVLWWWWVVVVGGGGGGSGGWWGMCVCVADMIVISEMFRGFWNYLKYQQRRRERVREVGSKMHCLLHSKLYNNYNDRFFHCPTIFYPLPMLRKNASLVSHL
jgi:hypothetical protein